MGYSCSTLLQCKRSYLTMWKIQDGNYSGHDCAINDKFIDIHISRMEGAVAF